MTNEIEKVVVDLLARFQEEVLGAGEGGVAPEVLERYARAIGGAYREEERRVRACARSG